ncbi:Beta-galactosidase C-terminal domain [Gaoshiqia sp. Z1-71]|uniref:Beta-galactosidase C-terminal domain n=1 Tax=Gaoshiqia hydrogeniformans TaxID=3290090 RepID=UPI003BF8D55A
MPFIERSYSRLDIPVENYAEGIMVEYRDGFGIALNYSDKEYQIEIPEGSEILIGSRQLLPAGVAVWKIQ